MWTLGLNGRPIAYHDAGACLVDGGGEVVAMAPEERFTRIKHGVLVPPRHAARFCLDAAGIAPEDVNVVAIGWDVPRMRQGFGKSWDDGSGGELLVELLGPALAGRMQAKIEFVPHHQAHAVSAFGASGFPSASVLVVDGQGEDESVSIFGADERGVVPVRSWSTRHSLGYLYEAATEWLGFGFLDAGKTMGLAAYGRAAGLPDAALLAFGEPASDSPVDIEDERAYWRDVLRRKAGRSSPSMPVTHLPEDPASVQVAWLVQRTVELAMIELAGLARAATGHQALCLAGGVALNCTANGLLDEPVFVPPVPHDLGVALGAAWSVCPPAADAQLRPDLGLPLRPLGGSELSGAPVRVADLGLSAVVDLLASGRIGALAEGRAEAGPRALGHRSILALPGLPGMASRLNAVKGREPWRPFGPAALGEHAGGWWDRRDFLERYMAGTVPMTAEGTAVAAAVRHVDGSTRPQVVTVADAPVLHGILTAMHAAGMAPVLVNTSFNRRGEPIVNSAADALQTFLSMDLDFLILGDRLLTKRGRY